MMVLQWYKMEMHPWCTDLGVKYYSLLKETMADTISEIQKIQNESGESLNARKYRSFQDYWGHEKKTRSQLERSQSIKLQ